MWVRHTSSPVSPSPPPSAGRGGSSSSSWCSRTFSWTSSRTGTTRSRATRSSTAAATSSPASRLAARLARPWHAVLAGVHGSGQRRARLGRAHRRDARQPDAHLFPSHWESFPHGRSGRLWGIGVQVVIMAASVAVVLAASRTERSRAGPGRVHDGPWAAGWGGDAATPKERARDRGGTMAYEVGVKDEPAQLALTVNKRVSMADHRPARWARLRRHHGACGGGRGPVCRPAVRHLPREMADEYDIVICMPVAPGATAGGGVALEEVPGGRVATTCTPGLTPGSARPTPPCRSG